MNKSKRVVLLIAIINICLGCSRDNDNPHLLTPSFGNASLVINGMILENLFPFVTTSKWNDTTINLVIHYYNEAMLLRGELVISNIPKIIGNHSIIIGEGGTTLGPGALYGSFVSDGHVGGDIFRYDSSLSYSYVSLDKYNKVSQEVEGNFDIELLRSEIYISSPELPDTLNISGAYYSKIDFK